MPIEAEGLLVFGNLTTGQKIIVNEYSNWLFFSVIHSFPQTLLIVPLPNNLFFKHQKVGSIHH